MRLVKTDRGTFLRALQIVSGIVERRHTLPILANVLLLKEGNKVSFLSTDTEVQITTNINTGSDAGTVGTTVSARKLLDILRALPDDSEVSLDISNKRMTIQSGKSHFSLQTLAPEEFPTLAKVEFYDATFTLTQKTMKYLFSMVHFSMAQQDVRYYLNGLLLVFNVKEITTVATDGHRMALCQIPSGDQDFLCQEVIVPRKTVIELQRLLSETDDPVRLSISDKQIKFSFSETELVSKLIEGKFPDYKRVVPNNYTKEFTIERETLLRSLQRAAIMANDKFKGVHWIVSLNRLKISSINAQQEEAVEELTINYQSEDIDIGFNVTYLIEVLNNLKCRRINIALCDSNSSALITTPENPYFKYVVMPMRI